MIRKFLDLSTSHVSGSTADWLIERCRSRKWGKYNDTNYGWFIHVGDDDEEDMPGDLRDIFTHARTQGCDYIMLDADADLLDELPTFEW